MTTQPTPPAVAPIAANDRIRIEKGCEARGVAKGTTAQVVEVKPLGADYSHSVQVRFMMLNGANSGKTFSFYARHPNRLADAEINLNDGNPSHTLKIRRA